MSHVSPEAEGRRAPPALMPLLRALGDLKRVRSAGRAGSIAERLFATAWARLVAGEPAPAVADAALRDALAATLLGDLDAAALTEVGLPLAATHRVRAAAVEEAARPLDPALRARLATAPPGEAPAAGTPNFVARLGTQPRAGVACPGRGRLVLEPPENHAEHCALVAVTGALLAPAWGARAETVFVAGLAHHLHNALLPDAGYTGELLLGEWLAPAMAAARARALSELPPALGAQVEAACRILPDASTPEGRAFHAADALDRVLQVEHHLRAAGTSMDFVLREMGLVHAGPVKAFQDAVLSRMALPPPQDGARPALAAAPGLVA